MKYSEFIDALVKNQDRQLTFEFDQGAIREGYHITEVFNIQVEAVDCGGSVQTWTERVLQLFETQSAGGGRFMEAKKALGILHKSAEKIDLSTDGNVILEFRPKNAAAAQRFNVLQVKVSGEKLVVRTNGATTQCKAASRVATRSDEAQSCCGPKAKSCCA